MHTRAQLTRMRLALPRALREASLRVSSSTKHANSMCAWISGTPLPSLVHKLCIVLTAHRAPSRQACPLRASPGAMKSQDAPSRWIHTIVPEGSDFTLNNLPWGVFKTERQPATICTRVGNHIVDVRAWLDRSVQEGLDDDPLPDGIDRALRQVWLQAPCWRANLGARPTSGEMPWAVLM